MFNVKNILCIKRFLAIRHGTLKSVANPAKIQQNDSNRSALRLAYRRPRGPVTF